MYKISRMSVTSLYGRDVSLPSGRGDALVVLFNSKRGGNFLSYEYTFDLVNTFRLKVGLCLRQNLTFIEPIYKIHLINLTFDTGPSSAITVIRQGGRGVSMNVTPPIPGHSYWLNLVLMRASPVDGQMACRIAQERCVNVTYDCSVGG
jgi:hypothetical protein